MFSASASPLVLLIGHETGHETGDARVRQRALEAEGWRAIVVASGDDALALAAREKPALILIDIAADDRDWRETARDLRRQSDLMARVPLIAIRATHGGDVTALKAAGFDDVRVEAWSSSDPAALTLRWHPGYALAAVMRLEKAFGIGEVARLLGSFRNELCAAIHRLDDGAADGMAHGIAGIAGTLGFVDVSTSWRALSEGDGSAMGAARRDALRAIAAIDGEQPYSVTGYTLV